MKRIFLTIVLCLLLASSAFAGGFYIPPDLTKVSGFTVIISGPSYPSQALIDQLTSYGIAADNILWRDTSGGNPTLNLTGVSASGTVNTIAVNADALLELSSIVGTGALGDIGVVVFDGVILVLTGNQADGSLGNIVVSADTAVALSSVVGTGEISSITVSVSVNGTITLTSVSAVGAVNSFTVAAGGTLALTGVSGTGAVGTMTVDVSGGGGILFEDDFTGSNGSALNASKWTQSTDTTIQTNKARVSASTGDPRSNAMDFSGTYYAQIDFSVQVPGEWSGNQFDGLFYIRAVDGDTDNHTFLSVSAIEENDGESTSWTTYNVYLKSAGNNGFPSTIWSQLGTSSDVVSATWKIQFTDTTHVRVYKNDVEQTSNPVAINSIFGSQVRLTLSAGGTYAEFDNIEAGE